MSLSRPVLECHCCSFVCCLFVVVLVFLQLLCISKPCGFNPPLFHLPYTVCCCFKAMFYASVNSSCAQCPPPPRLLQGICPPCQSRGWGICKFCAARRPGICQPQGYSGAFDTYAVSYQNITMQRILLEKSRLAHLSRIGGCKDCSRFYACISSLLIKPEFHSETWELLM